MAKSLSADGYEVVVLGKFRTARCNHWVVFWDGRKSGGWKSELEGAEALFNLSGRSVDCRYTRENRNLILSSRVDSGTWTGGSRLRVPKVWLNSSTATIYKDQKGDLKPHDESSYDFGSGFSVGVSMHGKMLFEDSIVDGVRKIVLRISIALGKDGGAFRL